MSNTQKQTSEPVENAKPVTVEHETRIDDRAIDAFRGMGYTGRLSDNHILLYREFKLKKDRVQPGRLTLEGLVCVAILAEMADGNLELS